MLISSLLFSTILGSSKAQDSPSLLRDRWSYGTAYLMHPHKWESGIAQPARYGINDKYEIHSNLLATPIFPNIGLKISHGQKNGLVFTSDHLITYPTAFMKTVRVKGAGGLISPQFDIPVIYSIGNSVMATKSVKHSLITAVVGFSFAIRNHKPDPQSTIDLPLVYPRMAHYYEGSTFQLGILYKGSFTRKLFYENGAKIYLMTRSTNNFFFENNGGLMWSAFRSVRLKIGYNLSYGCYPFGTMWQLWPGLDLLFGRT